MVRRHLDPLFSPTELIKRAISGLKLRGMHPDAYVLVPLRYKSAACRSQTKSVSSQPAMRCSLLGRMRRFATSTNARSANGMSLDRTRDSSRTFQRPSWSNKVRMARTGP